MERYTGYYVNKDKSELYEIIIIGQSKEEGYQKYLDFYKNELDENELDILPEEFFEHWGNIMEDRDLAEVLMDNPEGLFQDRVEDDDQEEEILNKIKGIK